MIPTEVIHPWTRVAMDIAGPMPVSSCGRKYILTLIDMFTRWLIAVPLRNQKANTVAKALLNNLISEHGCPIELLSDQCPNFMSSILTEHTKFLGIKKITSLA